MMALSRKMLEQEPGDIEALLPWYAAGTLNAREARRVEEALARDFELAKQYAVIREEYAETIGLNETLGAPSARAMQKLFAATRRRARAPPDGVVQPVLPDLGFFRPGGGVARTPAWSASLGALALVLQAGVIGAVLVKNQGATYQTASLSMNEPPRPHRPQSRGATPPPRRARWCASRRMRRSPISTRCSTIITPRSSMRKGGMFRLQFGDRAMSKDEISGLLSRLQGDKIVNLAVAAQ